MNFLKDNDIVYMIMIKFKKGLHNFFTEGGKVCNEFTVQQSAGAEKS